MGVTVSVLILNGVVLSGVSGLRKTPVSQQLSPSSKLTLTSDLSVMLSGVIEGSDLFPCCSFRGSNMQKFMLRSFVATGRVAAVI